MGTQIGDKSVTAYGLAGLGDVLMQQDQLAMARKQYDTVLNLREYLGEKQTILQTRVALAQLAIEQGHPEGAEPVLRQCQDQLDQAQLFDDELGTGLLLTGAFFDQMKNADARKEIVAMRPLEEKTQNRELQLRFSIEFARVLLAENDLPSARNQLDTVVRAAEASGFIDLAWNAQIISAEVQGKSGDRASAIHELKSLASRARSAGSLLRARKADTTAKAMANPG